MNSNKSKKYKINKLIDGIMIEAEENYYLPPSGSPYVNTPHILFTQQVIIVEKLIDEVTSPDKKLVLFDKVPCVEFVRLKFYSVVENDLSLVKVMIYY